MSTIGQRHADGPRSLATTVGLVVIALAVALGIFIQLQRQEIGPPEDVPRWLAIPALYATAGLLAVIGDRQGRPAIVMAAGIVCLLGVSLSVATVVFAIPGLALIVLAVRAWGTRPVHLVEGAVATGVVLLVVGAGALLLATTEGRCWEARGSEASPTYSVVRCAGENGQQLDAETFAGGYDSGVLTTTGGLAEAALLAAALALVEVTR
jgi:hypothetical protein